MAAVITEISSFLLFRLYSVTEMILSPYMRGRGSVAFGLVGKLRIQTPAEDCQCPSFPSKDASTKRRVSTYYEVSKE